MRGLWTACAGWSRHIRDWARGGDGRTARGNALHGVRVGRGERTIGLRRDPRRESGPELMVPALEAIWTDSATCWSVCFVAIPR